METENTPNTPDDLHWERRMTGMIHTHMPKWLPLAAEITRSLCATYGPHREESCEPQDLIDHMFLNAEKIAEDFNKLIQKTL